MIEREDVEDIFEGNPPVNFSKGDTADMKELGDGGGRESRRIGVTVTTGPAIVAEDPVLS